MKTLKGKAKKTAARKSIVKRALIRMIPIKDRIGNEAHRSVSHLRDQLWILRNPVLE